jgi:solute carrier family 25 carnitine/acylcarnitine transporter 20/29
VGGAVNAFLFVTPVELVRNQLIAQHTRKAHGISCATTPHYNGPWHVIRHLLSTRGIAGLWKGTAMTVLRDSLGCGCFFYAFYFMKQRVLPKQQDTCCWSSTAMAGAISGFGFWVVALPLDAVKTWVQNGSASSGREAILDSMSQFGALRTATRLLRGWQVAFGRGMPAAAVTMTTYEGVSNYLDQHF